MSSPGRPTVARPRGQVSRLLRRAARAAAESLTEADALPDSQLPPRPSYRIAPPATDAAQADVDRRLRFLSLLAEVLVASYAPAVDVEAAILSAGTVLGLRDLQVAVTNNEIHIAYDPPGPAPAQSRLRVVRRRTSDHRRLVEAHRLLLDLGDGGLGIEEAERRLHALNEEPRRYPKSVLTLANGVLGAAFALLVGGGPEVAAVTLATVVLMVGVVRELAERDVASFYLNLIGAGVVTLVAVLLSGSRGVGQPGLLVVAGIVVLLPSLSLVSAVQDALTGFVITSAGRLVEVLVMFGAIVAGVSGTLVVGSDLGVRVPPVEVPPAVSSTGLAGGFVLAGTLAAMAAITLFVPKRLLLPSFLLGGAGYAAFAAWQQVHPSAVLPRALVAVVLGFLAALYGARRRLPTLSVVVPAVIPLLPGLAVYTAMFDLTQGRSLLGVLGLFTAVAAALALAAGVILGEQLARPLLPRLAAR